jgi:hypothetical protein
MHLFARHRPNGLDIEADPRVKRNGKRAYSVGVAEIE